jgi:hypothetical protein
VYEYNLFSSLCPALWGDFVVIPISSDLLTKHLHNQHNSQYGKQPQQVAVTDDVTVYSLKDFCISIIKMFEVLLRHRQVKPQMNIQGTWESAKLWLPSTR